MLIVQFAVILCATTAAAFMGAYFGAGANPSTTAEKLETHGPRIVIRDTVRRMLAVIGVMFLAIGLGADYLGLGPNPGIGNKQVLVIILGAAILTITAFIDSKRPSKADEEESDE